MGNKIDITCHRRTWCFFWQKADLHNNLSSERGIQVVLAKTEEENREEMERLMTRLDETLSNHK